MEGMLAPIDEPLISTLNLISSCRIADIGCGGGGTTLEIQRRAPAGSVVQGFDLSPTLIELACSRKGSDERAIAFEIADMATASAPEVPYDRLVSRFGIMFFDDSLVKAVQREKGSRTAYSRMENGGGWQTSVTPELAEYLAGLDMFYLGTANSTGHPYIQYRGGPVGFLKVLDDRTLAYAEFGGNRQYITVGNLSENPKSFLFLMDYANSRRIKVWGTA